QRRAVAWRNAPTAEMPLFQAFLCFSHQGTTDCRCIKDGTPIDPVCGSGHCHIIPYWAEKLGKNELVAYQASPRGGTLYCRMEGDRIFMAGKAVLFSKSEILIPEVSVGGNSCMSEEIIQVRVDKEVRDQAEELLKDLGLDLSAAVSIFLRQCILHDGLPFKVERPKYNEETIAAMEEARRISRDPDTPGYDSMESLKAALTEDCDE
ncbi:MAG: type II toxin-antitoxin system RelB/DinJ family antitoxin, partial [Lachnospiraceae bacterium]